MTITRAIAAVLVMTLFLAAVGGAIGYALGQFIPGYYRGVFQGGHEPRFDPTSVGIGQGLTQGTAAGVLMGLAIVALLCWRDVRVSRAVEGERNVTSGSKAGRILVIVGTLLLLIVCSGITLLLGALGGERGAYHRRYLEEQQMLAPVLASDPAFSGIELSERSLGGVNFSGLVRTPEDMERLRLAVTRAVGETRAKELLMGVSVKP